MCNPNYLNIAIENALLMDLPDHLIPLVIADQARMLGQLDCEAGFDENWDLNPTNSVF